MADLCDELLKILKKEHVIKNADMKKYTSFKAGGKAALLVIPQTIEELMVTMEALRKSEIQSFFLGNGTNVLVKDSGYQGVIIKLGDCFSNIEVKGETLTAYAGARISAVAKEALEYSLTGLEFASGIPGSVGGAVFMNAGAYEKEIADVIESVEAIRVDGQKKYHLDKSECQLSYRHSIFHETEDIILSATFKLKKGNRDEIAAKMKELMEKRNTKQPVNLPSAGSFFKRPTGNFAGKLIQEAGLKGLSVGGAQVSPLHAGFVVNTGDATAADILELMKLVQNTVLDKFGVQLEPEVRILGD
ncbi:UDP-N-acetylmuramate dehydrogenase [Clostridium aminobutyricum]|uniref:UDP-N-acetylenolpyruvoylglucosamine reductase n=2 Tax=Clostridium aminobutyricum TaxID=33953 RepID=A0A939D890_CLOAM|nr:UDP-N-acetylmuramate dehydrogenase [Clostridium aminobutyricum]